MDVKYSTLVHVPSKCILKPAALSSTFYVVGKGKLILGLESSKKLYHISVHCPVEKSTIFGKAQSANNAKAQTTHPLLSTSDSQLPKQNTH